MTEIHNEGYGFKTFEILQVGEQGEALATVEVEATSASAAATKLSEVVDGTVAIKVNLDGQTMNEMGVDYWFQRVRRRR